MKIEASDRAVDDGTGCRRSRVGASAWCERERRRAFERRVRLEPYAALIPVTGSSGTEAAKAAAMYSLLGSAKRHGLDPEL